MPRKHPTKSSKGRRRRRHARREAAHATFTSVGIGDAVERGRGERRQAARIIGWSFDAKRRVTWLVVPR